MAVGDRVVLDPVGLANVVLGTALLGRAIGG